MAAEAAGIHKTTLINWMKWGQAEGAEPIYAEFAARVTQARAEARQDAENRVFQESPLMWLRYGPGRATSENPDGWTNESVLTVRPDNDSIRLTWAGVVPDQLEDKGLLEG